MHQSHFIALPVRVGFAVTSRAIFCITWNLLFKPNLWMCFSKPLKSTQRALINMRKQHINVWSQGPPIWSFQLMFFYFLNSLSFIIITVGNATSIILTSFSSLLMNTIFSLLPAISWSFCISLVFNYSIWFEFIPFF